jgi:hypothetical protein
MNAFRLMLAAARAQHADAVGVKIFTNRDNRVVDARR